MARYNAGMIIPSERHLEVAIIGAGFGGLGLGARLVQRGERNFRIFDRAGGPGGTWWKNRY
ncbi:MAG: NAD(P)-binding protein, partial [Wenzhouxiangellaceae bacterium]|nr:NAD(P)-binding protein [Wenzhouxiangellaceae bacterium]